MAEASDSFPQPKARLLSSEERLSEWLRRTSARAREELPVTIETVEPRQALPGWRQPWRDLEPAKVFLAALSAAGAPILLGGLREVEAVHRAIVREIERAREVVDFGFETARLEGGAGEAFAREAVDNALSLLTYQKGATPEIRAAVEASAAHAEAAVLLESDIALEKSRIGLLAHVTRRRGGEALRQLRGLAGKGVRASLPASVGGARSAYRWALAQDRVDRRAPETGRTGGSPGGPRRDPRSPVACPRSADDLPAALPPGAGRGSQVPGRPRRRNGRLCRCAQMLGRRARGPQ